MPRPSPAAGAALFLAADLPWPPDGGGRIATLRVLEAMASAREIDLLALADPESGVDLQHLRSICRRVEVVRHPFTFRRHRGRQLLTALRSLVSGDPYRLAKFRSRTFARLLRDLKARNRYDFVHHDQFGVATYVDRRLPSTLTTQNVESQIYELAGRRVRGRAIRLWSQLEAAKLRRAERHLYRSFDSVFVLSDDDRTRLSAIGVPDVRVLPVPAEPSDAPQALSDGRSLLTLGSMSWFGVEDGLLWFHEHVFPRIRHAVPDVEWNIVGSGASPAIRGLADGNVVKLHGYVPVLGPLLQSTRVCLVPLRVAGGVRIKLIEMLGRGLPCVATSLGAQGLSFSDGEGCFRRDEPAAFADAVIQLLRDDELWRQTSVRGWTYARTHHTRAAMAKAVDQGVGAALDRFERRMSNERGEGPR
jgi:glycosyltransferase involved in cell wall biosynthesis